jgi:uridylate kinase
MKTAKKSQKLKYKRVLLKLSGEVVGGENENGIDFGFLAYLCGHIKRIKEEGVQLAVVIGGGNFWRYRDFKDSNVDRVNSDYIGMMATLINSIALQDELKEQGIKAKVFSAIPLHKVVEDFSAREAIAALEDGHVVICAGGTGNPFCTTDSAAALRASELKCDLMVKATNVDYVYDKDPHKFKNARPFKVISYGEVLKRELRIMDLGAIATAMEAKIPIAIFNLNKPKSVLEILNGKNVGTFIY